jgi:hypothetical protein
MRYNSPIVSHFRCQLARSNSLQGYQSQSEQNKACINILMKKIKTITLHEVCQALPRHSKITNYSHILCAGFQELIADVKQNLLLNQCF